MATVVSQPQASRAGLISTIVIFVILTVLMTVLYFQKESEARKIEGEYTQFQKRYADAVTATALDSEDYHRAKDAVEAANKESGVKQSVFDLLNTRLNDLTQAVNGQSVYTPEVRDGVVYANNEANSRIEKYAKIATLTVPKGANIAETLTRWPAIADKLIAARDENQRKLDASIKDKAAADDTAQKALAMKDKQIADLNAEKTKISDQIAVLQKQQSDAMAALAQNATVQQTKGTQELAQVQTALAAKEGEQQALAKKVNDLKVALRRFKANPLTRENIVRQPDGAIATVAGNDCFINLGAGDQIGVGMTFEVYDPIRGVPALNDGTATPDTRAKKAGTTGLAALSAGKDQDRYEFELPKGKGSIEVTSVGPGHTSQCRIVKTEPGQQISQGDMIANLVYDKNIKYNFVVYGDFDLANSNSGLRTNDAPVIRRLIEQWGGHVQPITDVAKPATAITADTDFLIVGKEPVVPNFTAEELAGPDAAAILDRAKAKLEAYRGMLAAASDMGVPIMNQNRFLYYTGYFDQAKR